MSSFTGFSSSFRTYDSSPSGHEEDIESTERLVLRLLKEDHEEFMGSHHQNGKRKFGQTIDTAMSLAVWGKEIKNADQSSEDRIMALSMNDAIATDQLVIASMQQEETVAQADRAFALRLNDDPEQVSQEPVPAANPSTQIIDHTSESIYQTINTLGQECASSTHVDPTALQASSSKVDGRRTFKCVSCFGEIRDTPIRQLPCNHSYCKDCLHGLFVTATKDEGLYPPRCCKNIFPPSIAMRLLDFKELAAFCSAGVEFSTKDRLYCAVPSCSAFVPPWLMQNDKGTCPQCSEMTHTACGTTWSENHKCPDDEALQQLLGLAQDESWKRCPQCRTMVELHRGCNHMTCRCSAEFCYVCGLTWKTCSCPQWDEDNIIDVAQRNADIEVGEQADEHERAEALAVALQDLYNHEVIDCQHQLRNQWRWTNRPDPLECEVCGDELEEYIFQCKQCAMLACNKCIRNRMR